MNGTLRADLTFHTSIDRYGIRRYCYLYNDSVPSPTLRLHPGDELVLRLRNPLPDSGDRAHVMEIQGMCGGGKLYAASTNLHFHGIHAPPACHQDDVMTTLVEPNGGWYEYRMRIPASQPPGLYWYHPHPHGFSERQALGGASGAIVIEPPETHPLARDAFARLTVLRDRIHPGGEEDEGETPSHDISVNGVPVLYPANRPARIAAQAGRREFWQVLNAAADTYFDLQLRAGPDIHNAPYAVHFDIIGRDGSPNAPESVTHVLIPPGGRAEFVFTMPPDSVFAQLVTDRYDAGPAGESMPFRVLVNIEWQGQPAVRAPAAGPISILGPADLSGYGPRMPFLVISPYAKVNYVDHNVIDQSSVVCFIEDTFALGRIGAPSLDSEAGQITQMFNFSVAAPAVILDPTQGTVVSVISNSGSTGSGTTGTGTGAGSGSSGSGVTSAVAGPKNFRQGEHGDSASPIRRRPGRIHFCPDGDGRRRQDGDRHGHDLRSVVLPTCSPTARRRSARRALLFLAGSQG